MKRFIILTVLGLLLLSPVVASASIQLVDTPSGQRWHYLNPGGSVGSQFTSNISADVIRLGIFDEGAAGLAASHEVGVWDVAAANWIATVVIPSGTAADLENGYRWMTVDASLVAGSDYIVAAEYHDGGADYFLDTADFNPNFTFVGDLYVDGGTGLDVPLYDYLGGSKSWFGPNLEVVPAVPEPIALIVWLVLGGVGITFSWCRRNRTA